MSLWMGESRMMTAYVAVEEVDLSVVQARPPIGHLSLLVFRLGPEIEPWLPTLDNVPLNCLADPVRTLLCPAPLDYCLPWPVRRAETAWLGASPGGLWDVPDTDSFLEMLLLKHMLGRRERCEHLRVWEKEQLSSSI